MAISATESDATGIWCTRLQEGGSWWGEKRKVAAKVIVRACWQPRSGQFPRRTLLVSHRERLEESVLLRVDVGGCLLGVVAVATALLRGGVH